MRSPTPAHRISRLALLATFTLSVLIASENRKARRAKLWVFFHDKGVASEAAYAQAREALAPRSLDRRAARRTTAPLVDRNDLPIPAAFREAVAATGAELVSESRWLSGVSVLATARQKRRLESLDFVARVRPVRRVRAATLDEAALRDRDTPPRGNFYGRSRHQIEQLRLDDLHALGYTGKGVLVAVLDTGFARGHEAFNHPGHPLSVRAEHDFMNDDAHAGVEDRDDPDQHHHGTMVLAILGAYLPGEYVGAAYDATYLLLKVEDAASEYELEEDWFVAGLELAEAQGADVVSSSVVAKWYEADDLDGETSVMARAVDIATAKGLHFVQGAGNSGHDDDPETRHLRTPADAFGAITVGAVDRQGVIAPWSSDGPTVDGRVKPEVLALGARVITIAPASDMRYRKADGTSLATPLVAGVVACLVEAHPEWTVPQMRAALFRSARRYAETREADPRFVEGYGLVDAMAAHRAEPCAVERAAVEAVDCR